LRRVSLLFSASRPNFIVKSAMYKSTLLALLLFLYACGGSGSKASQAATEPSEKSQSDTIEEDDVIFQLSAHLLASPSNPAERQQNAIVNYAIDELIPLQRTPSGLFYNIQDPGEGAPIEWGDYLSAHYRGYFLNGEVFDASPAGEAPMEFYVGNMIPAWNEGLQLLRPGGKMQLFAPSALAYGKGGVKNKDGKYVVPPNQPLVFELQVVERLKAAEERRLQ